MNLVLIRSGKLHELVAISLNFRAGCLVFDVQFFQKI